MPARGESETRPRRSLLKSDAHVPENYGRTKADECPRGSLRPEAFNPGTLLISIDFRRIRRLESPDVPHRSRNRDFALRTLKRKLPLCISLSPRTSFRFAAVC
jgi:hypothetical protein